MQQHAAICCVIEACIQKSYTQKLIPLVWIWWARHHLWKEPSCLLLWLQSFKPTEKLLLEQTGNVGLRGLGDNFARR